MYCYVLVCECYVFKMGQVIWFSLGWVRFGCIIFLLESRTSLGQVGLMSSLEKLNLLLCLDQCCQGVCLVGYV